MEIIISDNYDAMSKRVADDMLVIMRRLDYPLLCPATGETTVGLYKELVQLHQQEQFDSSEWNFIGLDEWSGMNGANADSCRHSLGLQLLQPLQVKEERICFFDGNAENNAAECDRIEQFIQRYGPIDLAILGLGMNGHVGMNEPGTPATSRSHLAALEPVTQEVSQKYFAKRQYISTGLTLGIATLHDAGHIFLLVSGARKAAVVQKVIEGEVTEAIPATLLRNHAGLKIYLDADAAQMLKR